MTFLKQPFLVENHVSKADSTIFLQSSPLQLQTPRPCNCEEAFRELSEGLSRSVDGGGEPLFSLAEELEFIHVKSASGLFKARGLACLCERGRTISITLRSTQPCDGAKFVKDDDIPKVLGKSEFSAAEFYDDPPNWLSIRDQCQALGKLIFKPGAPPHGLVVICGSTNSAKSLIARGLIHDRLAAKCLERTLQDKPDRRAHLVTFEDPIETFFVEATFDAGLRINATEMARLAGIDYTPRERGKDVRDLKQGFADALRQTPTVYFIGEARDVGDWKQILEFAGTGHLVVTTAHAGSLLEMMMKIINACNAKTAAERRHYADKILAVVHMQYLDKPEDKGLLVPSVWRKREKGLAALTATGFSSIVPVESVDPNPSCPGGEESCFGNFAMFNYVWRFRTATAPHPNNLHELANKARIYDL